MNIKFIEDKMMTALLDNEKDNLHGQVEEIKDGRGSDLMTFRVRIDSLHLSQSYFIANLVKDDNDGDIYITSIEPIKNGLYRFNMHAFSHGMNMIKGFFTSNKYRDYVRSHSRRTQLMDKKRKLNREISKIDHKLDNGTSF